MAISLYDLSVPTFLQTLGAVEGFLGRGLAHCQENNIDPGEIVDTRLHDDMQPFRFQLVSVAHHSAGAMRAVKEGVFNPPAMQSSHDYAGLQQIVKEAREALEKLTPDEVNASDGRDVIFQFRDMKLPFTAADFLLSFSLPNFHFHATTAYDILRHKGVPLGKRDYMGRLRLKR